jgi:hypothetical protein
MILDKQLLFSDGQDLSGAAATTLGTNVVDTTIARDVGRSGRARIVAVIDTAFTGGTAVYAQLVQADNAALTSNKEVLATGATIADAAALAGKYLLDAALPYTSKRYIGIQYVTTGTHTTGGVSAGIVLDAATPFANRPTANTGLTAGSIGGGA